MKAHVTDESKITNLTKQEDIIEFTKEINNLLQISQGLETLPMIGTDEQYIFSTCKKSLNMSIGNLIKYNNQKQEGDDLGTNKTS